MTKTNPLKPYLKWAGGKRQLLSEIKNHLPANINTCTYYEPFIGAGALFFELQPRRAIINDFNAQLILTYRIIKENVDELIGLLHKHKEKNDKNYYYEMRNLDRDTREFNKLTGAEKAARLIYLNKTCYNGLYRVNSKGLFNVPYGRNRNPAIYDEILLRQINSYLNDNDITILNTDFEQAVTNTDENSFIYFDPPYHRLDKTSFTDYQANGFSEAEQERLRTVMIEKTKQGVKCLLSNSDTEFIRRLYDHDCFDIIPVLAKRFINADSGGRGTVNEVLIKNWKD